MAVPYFSILALPLVSSLPPPSLGPHLTLVQFSSKCVIFQSAEGKQLRTARQRETGGRKEKP
jgi:hypothetical protein